MREPILLEADDGFHFIATRRWAELSLEAIDIENGVYTVYDADGFKLHLAAAANGAGAISSPVTPENCSAELAPRLREYLSEVGVPPAAVSGLPFPGLVQLGVERFLESEPERLGPRLRRAVDRLLRRR